MLANLTDEVIQVALGGVGSGVKAILLDETTFTEACTDPRWRATARRHPIKASKVNLRPFAVAEVSALA